MKLALCLFLLSAACIHSSLSSPAVEFRDTNLVLRDQGKTVILKDVIDPYAFFAVCHAVQRRGKDYFVVYGSSEMSRGWPPRGGRCGSGIESYIRWLHIRDGKIVDQREGLYESCWKGRDGWDIQWSEGKLHWQTVGFEHPDDTKIISVTYFWTYDPRQSDAGITETTKPTEWQPTQ
jgi:hypothetical protein